VKYEARRKPLTVAQRHAIRFLASPPGEQFSVAKIAEIVKASPRQVAEYLSKLRAKP
jgi:predicted AAA+ superfamily ATPase